MHKMTLRFARHSASMPSRGHSLRSPHTPYFVRLATRPTLQHAAPLERGHRCPAEPAVVGENLLSDSGGSHGSGGGVTKPATAFDSGGGYEGWNVALRLYYGLQARIACDKDFLYKLAVECGIDAAIICAVNYIARGERFFRELDFVLCQMLVSCSNDFALVYLLAPTSYAREAPAGWLPRVTQALPAHVMAAGSYSVWQRAGCFLCKMVQYGSCGFALGLLGSTVVNMLTDFRELHDDTFKPPAEAPSIWLTGIGWLYFMGLSSNIRYNLVSWAEQYLYAAHPGLPSRAGSIVLRFSNNFAGAYQYVGLAERIGISQPRDALRPRPSQDEARRRPWWRFWGQRKRAPQPWALDMVERQ